MSETRDPFRELQRLDCLRRLSVLGAAVEFRSNDVRLLNLAAHAFGGLPRHRWRRARCKLRIHMRLVPRKSRMRGPPPAPRFTSGAECLIASIDADNFAIVDPGKRTAILQISSDLMASEYHARYELIELAAITLATRAQSLVPLHAACVGRRGRGLLVLGESGAGKSTFVLAAATQGLELLAEDSVFVRLADRRATGVAAFVHLRPGAVRLMSSVRLRGSLERSPLIRRRSGAVKYELDVRRSAARLAAGPLRIVGTLLLSSRRSRDGKLLHPIERNEHLRLLRRLQPYATRHPHWNAFAADLSGRGAYRLLRGANLADSVRAASTLLARPRS